MKRIYLSIIALVIAVLICGGGYVCVENFDSSPKENVTFYNNLNWFSFLTFRKSSWPSGPAPDLVWKPNNVRFNKGIMSITIDNDDNGLTSGEIQTLSKFGYGLYQVRMKPIKNTGTVSAFFTYAQEEEIGTEIDIEFLGYDTTKVQFNYFANGVGEHEYLYDLGFDAAEDFHEYAFCWTSDGISWFVDGELVYEIYADDIPLLETPIFMSAWAGDKPYWLKEYDGKVPLQAYYDWISFTSIDDMKQ